MIFPTPLKRDDKVALIAPSSPILSSERLDFAVSYLKNLGLSPLVGESCHSHYGHLAGKDELRAIDINRAFKDKQISGIFCIRGGNGAAKVLDKVDFEAVRNNPKFFCGYSDITALHIALNNVGLATYHTPMASEANFVDADEYTLSEFEKYIFDPLILGLIPMPSGHQVKTLVKGIAEGRVCGGNLSSMAALMGTPYEINTKGKILFIEEVGTNAPRVDRILNGLRLAGKFDDCTGVIFGDFTNCEPIDPAFSLSIPEILYNLNLKVPTIYNFPCGHILPTTSIPFGLIIRLNASAGTLEVVGAM
ncbi:MAG: LD-carboxypeptidase [Defluviitaleaceae bacterium]|nr:LD-carboxypeptidase [Defluviitaleaceae bacterium]